MSETLQPAGPEAKAKAPAAERGQPDAQRDAAQQLELNLEAEPSEAPARGRESPGRRIAVAAALVAALVLASAFLRQSVGFEASGEWMREWVASFGLWGPAIYIALLMSRHFLLLPSSLLVALGGAVFGVVGGSLAGGLGLYLNGLLVFYLFRAVRPASLLGSVERRYGPGVGQGVALVERSAPLVLFLATAVPPAPHTPVYGLASLTRVPYSHFALVTLPAAFVRAWILSLLGAGLVESDPALVVGSFAAILLGLGLCWRLPSMRALLLPPKVEPPA